MFSFILTRSTVSGVAIVAAACPATPQDIGIVCTSLPSKLES